MAACFPVASGGPTMGRGCKKKRGARSAKGQIGNLGIQRTWLATFDYVLNDVGVAQGQVGSVGDHRGIIEFHDTYFRLPRDHRVGEEFFQKGYRYGYRYPNRSGTVGPFGRFI
jgi:hypothetical protein